MSQVQYISSDGLEKLKQELQERKTIIRKKIAEKIGNAKELGDLSENFEYHEAKDEQGANETRILELEDLMHNLVIIDGQKGGAHINIGSTFSVTTSNASKITYQIVGASEADPLNGKISNESPLGSKFLGLSEGDKVEIQTPAGWISYLIEKIQ